MISVVRHRACNGVVFFYDGLIGPGVAPQTRKTVYPDGTRPTPLTKLADCQHCGLPLSFGSQHLDVETVA